MSPQGLAEASPMAIDAPQSQERAGQSPIVLALGSALLLWSAFVPADWSWLAWVALVPLFLLVRSERSPGVLYLSAWAGGLLFWLLSIQWVRLTDPDAWFAWLVMATVLSVWWPGFLALTRLAVLRLKLPLMLAAPVIWVGLEYVRAHILTGFPWYYLAHTQHRILPLIQVADLTGALGISLLLALVNACMVDLLQRRTAVEGRGGLAGFSLIRTLVVLVLLAATAGYGGFRLASARFHDGPRLALLQSNLEQGLKMSRDPAALLAVYRDLVGRAVQKERKLDLIVWPETSFPYRFVVRSPALSDARLESQARSLYPDGDLSYWKTCETSSRSLLQGWSDQVGAAMLVGSLIYDFSLSGPSKFNSAILFEPGKSEIQRYAKNHLVPFGEYVPFLKTFPWLTALTPYQGASVPSLTFGTEASWFTVGKYKFATAICFEDTIPQLVRRFFQVPAGERQPDVLLNISNDGWFQGSSELDLHLAISVFRAVENRVPIARAVNTGRSSVIDGNGKVLDVLPQMTEDVLFATVPLDDRETLYSIWGDWLPAACLALTVGLLPASLVRSFLYRQPS